MTETAQEHPRVVRPLDEFLLETKLSPAPIRDGFVSRKGVIEAARSSGCRAVGITAPAGYGKSTLMTEWVQVENRPVAWLSLDRFDDDPNRLLVGMASAYARMDPSWTGLVPEMRSPGSSGLGRAAPMLAGALARADRPFVFMVDDLHELRSGDCHDVLDLVMARFPSGSQFVTSSRTEQAHHARLRPLHDVVEIGVSDLSIDEKGAQQIFERAQVRLTLDGAKTVTQRTEGWPVGLQLTALIARDADEQAPNVVGDDRNVADYLYQEILSHQSEEHQAFLRRTSVLERMSGPLCDAVLDSTASTQTLRKFEASGLFVVALDRQRHWYRYHALFREFLLSELRSAEADQIDVLHFRAADWYLEQGNPELALEHLLDTPDRERVARQMLPLLQPMYQRGNLSTTVRWLTTLGEGPIAAYPPLAVYAAWYGVLTGDPVRAERWAAIVESAKYAGDPGDGSASFDSLKAQLRAAMCPSGSEAMLADAEFAISLETASTTWRHNALWSLAEALWLVEGADAARPVFVETSTVSLEWGMRDTFVLSESALGILALDEGRWGDAREHVQAALAMIAELQSQDYLESLLAFAAGARLSLHDGRLDRVREHLNQAMRNRHLATYVFPTVALRLRIQLTKVYLALGDLAAARQLGRECDELVARRPKLGTLIDELDELRERLRTSAQDATRPSILTPAEFRLLPYLQTHLSIAEIGERLGVSRNTVNSQISSIYRKLGASSRGEAVEQATANGLLGN